MRKKSIKTRINVLVSLFSLVFAVFCLHLYFDSAADRAETVQKRVIELGKDFSAATLAEEDALESLKGINQIKTRYHAIETKCLDCHTAARSKIFSDRYDLLENLFTTREIFRKKQGCVGQDLMEMLDSVSYIHEHHLVHLKNYLAGGAQSSQPEQGLDFYGTRLPAFEPETDIIRIAVQVQNSLVDIYKSFNDLPMEEESDRIRSELETRTKVFLDTVKAFDDYSLDAQDGILVEELLLGGMDIKKSFIDLLEESLKSWDLENQLDANRKTILAVFNDINLGLENKNNSLRRKVTLLKGFMLIAGMLFVVWVIIDGTGIVKEIRRIVKETEALQENRSYEISINDNVFEEFQVVYRAMNSMAGKINAHVGELEQHRDRLEQRVAERTRDLFLANQDLRSEIDERVSAEKELLDSRERLSLALDISGGQVWEWDLATGRLNLDGSVMEELGFLSSQRSITLKEMEAIHDPDSFEQAFKKSSALIKGDIPLYLNEHRIIWANGDWHTYRVYGKVVKRDHENKSELLLGAAIDITEQKSMEEKGRELESRLQHSQKMEAVGTLAGGIAHDFNNILGGIMGLSQLAKRNLSPDEKTYSYVEQILSASVRAKDLIQQIMAFSRTSTSEKEACSLEEIINESLKLLRASIPTNIEINQINQTNGPGRDVIMANSTQIHQVVMNLCTNAYQAMEESGGLLEVSVTPGVQQSFLGLEKDGQAASTWVKLSVSDTGYGMEKGTMARIFDPYFTTKKLGQGNGMGLATVHAIIKEHGGNIRVNSAPGKGSIFDVFLPEAVQEVGNAAQEQEDLPFGSERILVVDDEPILTNVLQASLEDLGYEVTAVNDSEEALARVRRNPDDVDMVILDYIMPKLKGDDLAREIMLIRDTIPIILCTGLKDPLTPEGVSNAGIREVISKPVDLNYMAMRVRVLLDQIRSDQA